MRKRKYIKDKSNKGYYKIAKTSNIGIFITKI